MSENQPVKMVPVERPPARAPSNKEAPPVQVVKVGKDSKKYIYDAPNKKWFQLIDNDLN